MCLACDGAEATPKQGSAREVNPLTYSNFRSSRPATRDVHDIHSRPMPLLLSPSQHDAAALLLPFALIIASVSTYTLTSSAKHSLFASAAAWFLLCAWSTTHIGAKSILDAHASQRLSWIGGVLLVLSQVCERAVDGRGLWTKVTTNPHTTRTWDTG